MRPADIHIPSYVKTILLLDRTKPKNETITTIEGVLTGQLPGENRAATQGALQELNKSLQISPRFGSIMASERVEGNSLTAAFPDPLSSGFVQKLCESHNAEAIVAIEVFDSDFIITDGKRKKKKIVGDGANKREIEVDEYYASGIATIKLGIRLYDRTSATIVDEHIYTRTNTWNSAAASKSQALAQLLSKGEATRELAKLMASDYAYKIAPLPSSVSRSFYKKSRKSSQIEQGSRLGDVNNWYEAVEVWKSGLQNADKKRSGILSYNIAIGYEVLGELDLAIKWAQDAYTKYENKMAKDYVWALKQRKQSEERLKQQMDK